MPDIGMSKFDIISDVLFAARSRCVPNFELQHRPGSVRGATKRRQRLCVNQPVAESARFAGQQCTVIVPAQPAGRSAAVFGSADQSDRHHSVLADSRCQRAAGADVRREDLTKISAGIFECSSTTQVLHLADQHSQSGSHLLHSLQWHHAAYCPIAGPAADDVATECCHAAATVRWQRSTEQRCAVDAFAGATDATQEHCIGGLLHHVDVPSHADGVNISSPTAAAAAAASAVRDRIGVQRFGTRYRRAAVKVSSI